MPNIHTQTKPNTDQTIAPPARVSGGISRTRKTAKPGFRPMPTRTHSNNLARVFTHKPLPKFTSSLESAKAWNVVRAEMENFISPALCRVWLDPVTCVGETGSKALCLLAPGSVVHGILRAYAIRLGALVREHTDFEGVFISDREAA